MKTSDFRREFLEGIKAEAAVTGEGTSATFVSEMANHLIDAEVMIEFNGSYYSGTGERNKKYRIDGYGLDEFDNTMYLIIADYYGVEDNWTMTKTRVNQDIGRLSYFVQQALDGDLYKKMEISTPCADLVDLLRHSRNKIRRYKLFLFTDGVISNSIKTLESISVDGKFSEIQLWDIDRMYRISSAEVGKEPIEINFLNFMNEGIPCLEADCAKSLEYKSYLCIIPGEVLADIYDEYGSELLEGNVRSFLSTKVAVNKKIRETILTKPTMFFAFNNGISATAKDITFKKTANGRMIIGAKDFQIINGGQTTASLSNTRHRDKVELNDIYVQMKLTQIGSMEEDKSTELVRNISRSSNSQNKVSDADFFATHPFHIRMEQFSRRVFAPAKAGAQYETKWFYERARGQYLQAQMRMTAAKKKQFQLQNPKAQVITKTDFAKYRNSWDEMPHIVSQGAQKNFMKYATLVDEKWEASELTFNELYFEESMALAILFKYAEKMVPKQDWYEHGYRANIVTYSIAVLHKLLREQFKNMTFDLMTIWNRQEIPEIVEKALVMITREVYLVITAEDRPVVNVTQWCKKTACWDRAKNISIDLDKDFEKIMLSKNEVSHVKKEAKKDQKIISGANAQEKVLQYSADKWNEVYLFAKSIQNISPDEELALKLAVQIPRKIPNSYQSKRLLALIERLKIEGLNIE